MQSEEGAVTYEEPVTPAPVPKGRTMASRMKVGTTYCMFVAPGWIIAGTVDEQLDDGAIFVDVVWLDGLKPNKAHPQDIPRAKTAKDLDNIVEREQTWSMVDETMIRHDQITWAEPCLISMKPLARLPEAKAITQR